MFQRDYLLKQIEDFARFLGVLLKLRKEGNHQVALQEIDEAYKGLLRVDKSVVVETPAEELIQALIKQNDIPLHKLKMLVDLLFEEGENLLALDHIAKSREAFQRSLILMNYVNDHDEVFSMEWMTKESRIQEFLKKQ